MNERIEKLLIQSEVFNKDGTVLKDVTGYELNKFAELIVRECAKVCNDVGVAIFAEPVQNNFGTAQTCKLAIEKHFGVEE